MRAVLAALLLLFAFGCQTERNYRDASTARTKPVEHEQPPASAVVYKYVAGEARPMYIPDKSKAVESVAVGREIGGGSGMSVDGHCWPFVIYAYAKVTFEDGSTIEHGRTSLVHDASGPLVAIEPG